MSQTETKPAEPRGAKQNRVAKPSKKATSKVAPRNKWGQNKTPTTARKDVVGPFVPGFAVEQVEAPKVPSNAFQEGNQMALVSNHFPKRGGMQARTMLKRMLECEITVQDLPVKIADKLRKEHPQFFDDIERRFTFSQILELVQLNLLFAKSDYVKQQAIEAIKNRVEGRPTMKLQVQEIEEDPTEFILSNGRKITI